MAEAEWGAAVPYESALSDLSRDYLELFDSENESSDLLQMVLTHLPKGIEDKFVERLMRSYVRSRIRESFESYRLLYASRWGDFAEEAEQEFIGHLLDCVEARPWPSTEAAPGSQPFPEDVFGRDDSPLSRIGYRVGKTKGLPESERRRLLRELLLKESGARELAGFEDEFGRPKSHRRLYAIAERLAAFARNARRRSDRNYEVAIAEWESDLAYLKKYRKPNGLPWPSSRS